MILSDPIPWSYVPAGAQVLFGGVPRTVLLNEPYPHPPWQHYRTVRLEGLGVEMPQAIDTVQLVVLDGDDAVANLLAAGLTAAQIEPAP